MESSAARTRKVSTTPKATPARTARIGRAATASPMNASTNRTRGFLPHGCRGYRLLANLPQTGAGSTGRCNTISKFTCRSLKAQSLSRALIEAQSYLVEIGLRGTGQGGFFGEVLSQ